MYRRLLLPLLAVTGLAAQPALTIYNNNFGVVRDSVELDLKAGENEVSYTGATRLLEPESVVLRDPAGQVALSLLEQSYRGDALDEKRLLKLFEGQTIDFLKEVDGREVLVPGKIVRAPVSGLTAIIEVDGQLVMALPGRPMFPGLGDDSVLLPTLNWTLHASKDAQLDAQLSYITDGLNWKADYNFILPESGEALDVTGLVSVTNLTGKTFEEAQLKLVAGDVNKVRSSREVYSAVDPFAPASVLRSPPRVEEKKFDEFHLYSLPRATTLYDQETKQVEFLAAQGVKNAKQYVYNASGFTKTSSYSTRMNTNQNFQAQGSNQSIEIYREIENTEANGLGIPIPAGRARFYRMDSDLQMEFVGEDAIEHTAKDETLRVYLGNAFDLVGERTQTKFFKHASRNLIQETFQIELRNRSDEPVLIVVQEALYRGSNWDILVHSDRFEVLDSRRIEFEIELDANSTEEISYTVEYTW